MPRRPGASVDIIKCLLVKSRASDALEALIEGWEESDEREQSHQLSRCFALIFLACTVVAHEPTLYPLLSTALQRPTHVSTRLSIVPGAPGRCMSQAELELEQDNND